MHYMVDISEKIEQIFKMNKMNKNSVNLSVSSVYLCETKAITRSYTEKTQSYTEKNLINLENLNKILVQTKGKTKYYNSNVNKINININLNF